MTRSKVKLAYIRNENAKAICLKRRRLGLVKKIRELTILCDLKACMIMFIPNEVVPMVWPSVEVTRNLLNYFFALSEFEKKNKETSYESYLVEKIRKLHKRLTKLQNKNIEFVADQLLVQLQNGRKINDLNLSEINDLQSFSQVKIMLLRKKLGLMQHRPRSEPLVHPLYKAQYKEFRTNEAVKRIYTSNLRENQTHYLIDKWVFASHELLNPKFYQKIQMELASYNNNLGRYISYQGSSSNGTTNLEMELFGPPMMTFHSLVGSVSQPLQYHNSYELRSIPFAGLRQDPPPNQNGTTTEEDNFDATLFDTIMDWSDFNNFHF